MKFIILFAILISCIFSAKRRQPDRTPAKLGEICNSGHRDFIKRYGGARPCEKGLVCGLDAPAETDGLQLVGGSPKCLKPKRR